MAQQEPRFELKMVDMPDEVIAELKTKVKEAFQEGTNEREIAALIKKHFDERHGAIWHCVVGKSFGAFGTHETNHFVYLYYGQTAIQLWKCG
jgi:dynein light chain LC8-type